MALHISFEGYVLEVTPLQWGTALKVSHQQRAKNDQTGEWETVGYDYLEVLIEDGDFAKGDIVKVEGTLRKGKIYTKKDGSQDYDLKVRASAIEKVDRGASASAPAANDEAPF